MRICFPGYPQYRTSPSGPISRRSYDTRTTSSRTTYVMSRALDDAVRDLRESGGGRGHGVVEIPGGLDPDTGRGVGSHHWHQAAASCELRVDEHSAARRPGLSHRGFNFLIRTVPNQTEASRSQPNRSEP